MRSWVQTFLAGVVGALTVGVLIAATDPLALRNDGIQFPDGSVQTTAAASFGLDDAANSAVHLQCSVSGSSTASSVDLLCGESVPLNKTLVIEHISALVSVLSGCDIRGFFGHFNLAGGYNGDSHWLTFVPEQISGSTQYFIENTPMRVHFPEFEKVGIRVLRNCTGSSWGVSLDVSGYYVDKTQP